LSNSTTSFSTFVPIRFIHSDMSARITRVALPTPPTSYKAAEKPLQFDGLPDDHEVGLFDDQPQTTTMTEPGHSQQISNGRRVAQSQFAAMPDFRVSHATNQGGASYSLRDSVGGAQLIPGGSPSMSSVTSQNSSHNVPPTAQATIARRRADKVAEKFGMITPPDACEDGDPMEESVEQKGKKAVKSHDKSENARKAANKRHAKEKSRKLSLAAEQGAESIAEELESEGRKEQYREKNKIAAAKCRNKKRKYNDKIDLQAADLESRNKALKTELMDLRNVVLILKDQILKHSPQDCSCTRLHEYSMAQAARMLENSQSYRMGMASMSSGQQLSSMHPPASRSVSMMSGVSQPAMQPTHDRRMFGSLSEELAAITMAGDMSMTVSSNDLLRRPEYAQPFQSYHPQYVSNDDMHSANGSTLSPIDMSDFSGVNEYPMTSPNGEVYNNMQFGDQWDYFP